MKAQFNPKRSAAVVAVCFCLTFLMIYKLILATGLIPGANPSVDIITVAIQDSEARRITVEGRFLDRNGDAITEPGDRGKPAKLLQPEAYSYLIGFNSPIYETSGLRDRLYKDLFYGGDDGIGAEVTLTTDNALQQFCYEQIGKHEGSVIVMNAHTGELLACASRSSGEIEYNVNIIDQRYDANEDGVVDNNDPRMYSLYAEYPAFFLNRATTSEDPPGSTFKIVTSTAMIENGMGDYTFDDLDGTYQVGGKTVTNVKVDGAPMVLGPGADMALSLRKSANVYFASGAVEMGAKAFQETAERFLLCQNVRLDFATLKPNFDLGNMNNKVLLADTGYGQGKLQVSPLQVGMIMGAVMNDGQMMMPYLIQTITDDGEVERQTKPAAAVQTAVVEGIEQVVDETPPMQPETAETLKKYLHATAVKQYGLDEESYGMVYAKTGTAEISSDNHIYMVAAVEDTSWGDLVVVVDRAHVNASSSDLKGTMKNILGYLVTA